MTPLMADLSFAKIQSSRSYSFASHKWLPNMLREKAIRKAAQLLHGTLLDIGCGQRPFEDLFRHHVSKYIGIDLRKTLSVVDIFADGLCLPFTKETFDTVTLLDVLEHVPQPENLLEEVHRVLKKHGCVIITTPHMWGIHCEPNDFYRYTPFGLKYLLSKTGFNIAYVNALGGYWITAGTRFCYYLSSFEFGSKRRKHLSLDTTNEIRLPKRNRLFRMPIISIYAIVQMLAYVLDRVDRYEYDAWSHITVAFKEK